MLLFNLSLPDGVYVVGDWNGWEPSEKDRMEKVKDHFEKEIPVASFTFYPSEDDPADHIGWYKVVYVRSGEAIVSSSIPVWKENLKDATRITVYASPSLIKDGFATGVGDSGKMMGDWYAAGDFNSWTPTVMERKEELFVYTVERSGNEGDTVKYKIARSNTWKPYETQYDGKHYHAGYGQDAIFTADSTYSELMIIYDPKFSLLEMRVIK